MNINPNYDKQDYDFDNMDAMQSAELCMEMLAENIIIPMSEKGHLSDNDILGFNLIRVAVEEIAKKAYAFEQMCQGEKNKFYYN